MLLTSCSTDYPNKNIFGVLVATNKFLFSLLH